MNRDEWIEAQVRAVMEGSDDQVYSGAYVRALIEHIAEYLLEQDEARSNEPRPARQQGQPRSFRCARIRGRRGNPPSFPSGVERTTRSKDRE